MTAGRLVLPVLVALGLGLAPPARPQVTGAPGRADSSAARVALARRPFDHRYHEQVACSRCHGTGARHQEILVHGPADCASCHHDPGLGKACADCHRDKVHQVIAPAARPVWAPGFRRVFDHRWHGSVACTDCHHTGTTDRVMQVPGGRDCGNCHHDAQRARPCVGCHENKVPGSGRDTRAVAVAGMKRPFEHQRHERVECQQCHGSGARDRAMTVPARPTCMSCHHHQPAGKTCLDCHHITGPEAGLRGGGTRVPRPGSEE